MPTDHDAIAALPNTGAVRDYLRALLFNRMAYVLADGDNPQDLVTVDPETGAAVICLVYRGRIYLYDPTDTTTEHDGMTTLVTLGSPGGRRYKLDTLQIPRAVLDKDLVSPPGSPAIGDAYLINGAPSGGWATIPIGSIVVFTARGWEAIIAPIGSVLYVRDEGGYYHKNTGGTWAAGLGATALTTNSVLVASIVNAGRFFIVENRTTNAPPSSPQGTAYIIGSSPSGGWAGHAGKIAIREATGTGNTYSIYPAAAGMRAYDKSQGRDYQFNGTTWQSASGRWRMAMHRITGSATFTKHPRCFQVRVFLKGGGQGGYNGGSPGTWGNTTYFGGLQAAPGGGDNVTPPVGDLIDGGLPWVGSYGRGGSGDGGIDGSNGWESVRVHDGVTLPDNTSVIIGAGGGGGGGSAGSGTAGVCVIEEYIED